MRGKCFLFVLLLGLAATIGTTQPAEGAGFALYEGSARGNALGGAVVGRADDPSAVYYNPAGITQLPGLQILAGATAIMPSTTVVRDDGTYHAQGHVWVPPHFYATYQFSDKLWFGLGAFSPYGLGVEFDSNWPGRANNIKTIITSVNMNPTIAWKMTDQLSVALGLDIMYFNLDMKKTVLAYPLRVDTELKGDSVGYGGNIALHYRPTDWLSAGVSYRSQVTQNLKGDAKFNPNFAVFTDSSVNGSITLPDEICFGVAVKPAPQWSVEAGFIWTRWSTYKDLTMEFGNALGTVSSPKNWHDTMRYNLGVEYKATDWLDLRAGYVFDEEPIPDSTADYIVPADDRHNFSVGPGFHFGPWNVDISYTYIYITDRDASTSLAPGVAGTHSRFVNGDAHLVGASVGYKF
ncbi:MAG: OmpP1/FadL family transporter [Syntrophobacteraceae bacterium]